jgi:hypothetical protein
MLLTTPTMAQALLGGPWGGARSPPHRTGAEVVDQLKQTGRPERN